MSDQTGRFKWIVKLSFVALIATLVLIGLAMAWTISQIIVALMETGDWRETFPLAMDIACLLYTSPSPRDRQRSRMPSSA